MFIILYVRSYSYYIILYLALIIIGNVTREGNELTNLSHTVSIAKWLLILKTNT